MCTRTSSTKGLNTKGREKKEVSEEYFFSFADSSEFASQLEPPEEVDKFEGTSVSQQVKFQRRGNPFHQGIDDIPSGLFPSLHHTLTGSKTAGTPPDTNARRIVSLTAVCRGM